MAFRSAWIVVSAFAVAGARSSADEGVRLEVKWVKGAMWTVDQRLELSSASKGKAVFAGGAGVSQMLVKGNVVTSERWTDEVTAEAEGRPTELQRTFAVSKITAQKKAAGATALQGVKFVLGVGSDSIEIRSPKDGPEALVRTMLGKPPLDAVEILLPKVAVAVGAEWEIATEDVMRFQGAICLGVAGVKGGARDDVALLLKTLGGESPASAAKIVKGRLVKVDKGVAEIAFTDDKTHDTVADAGVKGPLFDLPPSTTKIDATLQFDVGKGRPIHLVWAQVHDMGDFTPRAGTPGGGVKTPGFTETWKLDKSWK
jgi:hypothetical protein